MSNTIIDKVAALQIADPTAKFALDVLVRGDFGAGPGWGKTKGASFTLRVERDDPISGKRAVTTFGPIDASLIPTDLTGTPLAKLFPVVAIQQQKNSEDLQAQIAVLQKQVADLTIKQTDAEALQAKVDDLQKQVADFNKEKPAA